MTSSEARVYVDFLKTDESRRLLLSTLGTREDLARHGIELHEGRVLRLYGDDADDHGNRDDLVVDGIAHFDADSQRWVAVIDWNAIRHESDAISA